jgi:hypothetical protein
MGVLLTIGSQGEASMKGSEMTLAHWLARKAIKAQWRARGLRLQTIEPSELTRAARAYLGSHPELVEQAKACLARCANLSSDAQKSRT